MPSAYYVEAQYLDGTSGRMISDDTAADYGIPKLGTLSLDEAIKQEFFTADSNLLGQQWRVLALPITSEGEYTGVVAIALPLRDAMQTVERTRLIVAFTDSKETVMFLYWIMMARRHPCSFIIKTS